ncbi:TraR/DksA C4-type zinc finger protein [Serratia sp. PL3]|uniref:TraR/DksA C4-type zinc finger protein n=1 Tax=unclassified Serratia (in: enterobacteria) TaxID=2647522 RepID=UPI0039184750
MKKFKEWVNNNPSAAHECDECGEEIPEARRRTVPGVRLCIDCKELEELNQRTHR